MSRPRQCFLQVSGNTLQQVAKFKFLGVVFTSDESRNRGTGTRVGKANAVLRELRGDETGAFKERKAFSF